MLYRNLLAMETEELISAQPMDAVVLLGGCDKTVLAQLTAPAVIEVPAILDVVGPAIPGSWRGQPLGACTDCRRLWAEHRAGTLTDEDIDELEGTLPLQHRWHVHGDGDCIDDGADGRDTRDSAAGAASPPAPSGARLRHGAQTGRAAVRLARRRSSAGPRSRTRSERRAPSAARRTP